MCQTSAYVIYEWYLLWQVFHQIKQNLMGDFWQHDSEMNFHLWSWNYIQGNLRRKMLLYCQPSMDFQSTYFRLKKRIKNWENFEKNIWQAKSALRNWLSFSLSITPLLLSYDWELENIPNLLEIDEFNRFLRLLNFLTLDSTPNLFWFTSKVAWICY